MLLAEESRVNAGGMDSPRTPATSGPQKRRVVRARSRAGTLPMRAILRRAELLYSLGIGFGKVWRKAR